jgi:phage-related protein
MPDDVFRWVIALGVILASISFVVQAGVILALYRVARNTQSRVLAIADRVDPIVDSARRVVEQNKSQITEVSAQVSGIAKDVRERLLPRVVDLSTQAAGISKSVREQVMPRLAGISTEAAGVARTFREQVMPRVAEISADAAATVRSVRQQVDKVGEVVSDTADRAHDKIARIDETVEGTVETVQHVGESVKGALSKPIREVNGIFSGVRAAITTYAQGGRRAPVDHATQDEEMFI